MVNLAERFLLQSFVLATAAQRMGYINEDSLAATRHQMRNEEVLGALRQAAVLDAVEVTEEQMRSYYEEQTHRFYARDKVGVAEVLLESEEEAMEVRSLIEAGTDMVVLARERSIRPGAAARCLLPAHSPRRPSRAQAPTVHGRVIRVGMLGLNRLFIPVLDAIILVLG